MSGSCIGFNKENVLRRALIPGLILFLLFLWIHMSMNFSGDDIVFGKQILNKGWYISRYTHWSSRLLLETVLVTLCHLPVIIWRIMDTCVMWLTFRLMVYFMVPREHAGFGMWCAIGMAILFPMSILRTAGWCATTLNYLWPVAAGLVAMIAWKRMYESKSISKGFWLLSILTLIFALDFEMMWIFCFVLFVALIYFMKKKSQYKYILISYGMVIFLSFLKIALCPGNKARYFSEIHTWWPTYANATLFDKLVLSLMNMSVFFLSIDILLLFLTAVMAWLVWRSKSSLVGKFTALIPFAIKLCFMSWRFKDYWMGIANRGHYWTVAAQQKPFQYAIWGPDMLHLRSCLYLVGGIIFFIAFAYVLYRIYGKTRKSLCLIGLYLAGCATSYAMAFSPTLFASSTRIFFVNYVAFMGIMLACLEACRNELVTGIKSSRNEN